MSRPISKKLTKKVETSIDSIAKWSDTSLVLMGNNEQLYHAVNGTGKDVIYLIIGYLNVVAKQSGITVRDMINNLAAIAEGVKFEIKRDENGVATGIGEVEE